MYAINYRPHNITFLVDETLVCYKRVHVLQLYYVTKELLTHIEQQQHNKY